MNRSINAKVEDRPAGEKVPEERPLQKMRGQEFMAELVRRSGWKAVFFVPTFLYPTLVELADQPVRRVLCHSEKAAG